EVPARGGSSRTAGAFGSASPRWCLLSAGVLRRDGAEPAGLEVLERLQHLGLAVHDERTGPCQRLTDRPATEHEDLERRVPAVLVGRRLDRDDVARAVRR